MAINLTTGLPETPEEEQARLQAQFAAFRPAVAPPALGAAAPTPAPPPLATEPLLAASLPPPPEPLGLPLAPEARASFAEPTPVPAPPPIAKPPHIPVGGQPSIPRPLETPAGLEAQQEQVAATKGDMGVARAGIAAQAADAQAAESAKFEQRRADLQRETDAEMAKRTAALDAATETYNGMGFKDFWSRASIAGKEGTNTGARILGAISMALGAAGAGLAHMPDYAMEMIDKAIDRDYKLQQDTILKARDTVEQARFGVSAAQQAKAGKLLDLANWKASAYEQTAQQWLAIQAKQGVPEAEAEKNAGVVAARAKAQETRQAILEQVAKLANIKADTNLKNAEAEHARAAAKVDKTKPLTESQGKAADLGARMVQDNKVIEKLGPMSEKGMEKLRQLAAAEEALKNSPKMRAILVSSGKLKPPEQVLNDHDRLVYAAGARWLNSFLRGDSGGAITASEYLTSSPPYLPQIGDKTQDVAGKAAARQQANQGRMIAAGPAGSAQAQANAVAPVLPTETSSKPARLRLKDGRTATLGPDGNYHADGP